MRTGSTDAAALAGKFGIGFSLEAKPETEAGNPRPQASGCACYHCGQDARAANLCVGDKHFCCNGCLTVFRILTENGLDDFYRLGAAAGVRINAGPQKGEYDYLNDPAVSQKLIDFSDGRVTRVTFHLPAIHCIACVWLLENLFRLNPAVGNSKVNFPRKEISLAFENGRTSLADVVTLLASLGYAPELNLSDVHKQKTNKVSRRLWLQIGLAGFAFGNTMLFSIAEYFGLDGFSGPRMNMMFGYTSLLLGIPVVLYSAMDYWRAAWMGLRGRVLTIDVPISLGILALFLESAGQVVMGNGVGYFDSLTGLVFFLLCGKIFQQRTYARLAFDRDYKSFFPLSTMRLRDGKAARVSLSQLAVGDRLAIRNGELIPGDALLAEGAALIDYSFVTGESQPVPAGVGDYLYAGGRQTGAVIVVEMVKEVSQSYLTSLWNQESFRKKKDLSLDTLTNRYSRRFTWVVLAVAFAAGIVWSASDASVASKAFTSVLIVACPCALALAAPFVLGTAQRILAGRNVFLKSSETVEALAAVDSIVFDKTGTLTESGVGPLEFRGTKLSADESLWIHSVTSHSNHPGAIRICKTTASDAAELPVSGFEEIPGCGIKGSVAGHNLCVGSRPWLLANGVSVPNVEKESGSAVHVSIGQSHLGCFILKHALRNGLEKLIPKLGASHQLALLSGDNDQDKARFEKLFGPSCELHFNQGPHQKLAYIESLQARARQVMMIGDGLNDAGAFQQSHVGVAVVENIGAFSPASDVIVDARMVPQFDKVLSFTRQAVRLVKISFIISAIYNAVGITIAARGMMSPVICAVLMPLSSVTVVGFACLATAWCGKRAGLTGATRGGTAK